MPLGRKAASMLRALDKLLVRGLGALPEETARDLGGFLRSNGLGKAADRALALQKSAPEQRYRAFVELRIALEEAVVKLHRPEGGPAPATRLMPRPSSRRSLRGIEELSTAAQTFEGTPTALLFLQGQPDLSGLSPQQVGILLGNDDLRGSAAPLLRKAPTETVRTWTQELAGASNGLTRRGVYLLAPALPAAEATRLTFPSWSHPEDQDEAFEYFHPRRMDCRDTLAEFLLADQDTPREAQRFALRMVARSAREKEVEKWDPGLEDDPELSALLKVARFRSGEKTLDHLRSWASSHENPELRSIAILQCWLEGDCDPRAFQQEIQRSHQTLPLILGPLRSTSRTEAFLKQWAQGLDPSRPLADRQRTLDEVLACGDRQMANHLLERLSDPSPAIRERLLPFLSASLGLLPVRLQVDLSPLIETPFEEFSLDILRSLERFLLPCLQQVPDIRVTPLLGYLLRRSGTEAVPSAILQAQGEAMLPEYEILLGASDQRLQLLALRELEALKDCPRAGSILEAHQSGRDPLENAVEKLMVENLRDQGRQALGELDRAQAVPRLLETARTRKEARDHILDLLSEWRAAGALSFLTRLLGSPLPDMVRGKPGNRETRWLQKSTTTQILRYQEEACPTLEAALTSENWTVRHHAAFLLGELAKERSSPALAQALEQESEEEVRGQILLSLGKTGGLLAVEALEPLLRSCQPSNQMRAARALASVDLPQARALLQEVLDGTQDLALKRFLRGHLHDRKDPTP